MNGYELLAILVFFLIGYWVVDYFWPTKKKPDIEKDPQGPERKS